MVSYTVHSISNWICIYYVVLGPLLKIIIVGILPESYRNELKYLLKIALMFLSIIVKLQVPTLSIIECNSKTGDCAPGPWSASVALGPRIR